MTIRAEKSIKNNGLAIIIKNLTRAFHISNIIAPEHLEILLPEPEKFLPLVKNTGSVFLGPYTPEAVGDYFAGPNHILPTMGTAKFMSQRGVYDFVKRTGFARFSKQKLEESKKYICKIAYSHFPCTVEVKKSTRELHVVNFLGEKAPRMTKYLDNVDVEVDGEDVILTGPDKETLGQTAANLKRCCRIRKKDPRVFQDGVYRISKGGR